VVGPADGVTLDIRTGLHDMRRGAFWPSLREFEHTGTRQLDKDLAQALTGGSGEMLEQLIKVRERALAELRDG